MIAAGLLTTALIASPTSLTLASLEPALWLRTDGTITIHGQRVNADNADGAAWAQTPFGRGIAFNGQNGGVRFKDRPEFRIAGDLTVSAWVRLERYWTSGPGAQVVFYGDARSGLDPFDLTITGGGTVKFGISDADYKGNSIAAELPLKEWTHVTASYERDSGLLRIWINGDIAGMARTRRKPILALDPKEAPGMGIGNVQGPQRGHNQPLAGQVADVRVYHRSLTPEQVGFVPRGTILPRP